MQLTDRIGVMLDPNFWLRIKRVDHEWDERLTALLDTHKVVRVSPFLATIGPVYVWIGNYPFAYGTLRKGGEDVTGLPRRKTAIRLMRNLLWEDTSDD